jgi:phosphatidylserine decarboxylase
MSLELAWGRFRRACLRTFFPSQVARMAALRQGTCPNCPHEIVDPRDLKYVRNVCGYWFRPEDDPYAWRGGLGLARHGLAEILSASAVFAGLAALVIVLASLVHPGFLALLAVVLPPWAFVLAFFRDPRRSIPADPALLVSPADGVVTHIDEVEAADFPTGRALRVSIFLSVFNVHVNRAPRTARVLAVRYFPGAYLDARHSDCPVRNEQLWIDFEDQRGFRLRVKQIAGAIARRIVCWLKPGEDVHGGDRFGMIKFGSRTEILVPREAVSEVLVRVGDRVKGGSNALLSLRHWSLVIRTND